MAKQWDRASYEALVKYAEQGGTIRNMRDNKKTLGRFAWHGTKRMGSVSKITVGFRDRQLTDNPER